MAIIATAGHVDHGKSALVRALTGTDPDRFAEEKRRGMTLDLGFAFRDVTDDVPVGRDDDVALEFVDVPGHGDLVRTMIAGVWAADVILLVVDVHEGMRPQTEEHLAIAGLLAAGQLVVALTKCDLDVDGDVVTRCADEIRARLSASRWPDARIIATSARDGRGIDDLIDALRNAVADVTDTGRTDAVVATRLFVDRSFVIDGAGTVVTGTLRDGPLSRGAVLEIVRTGRRVRVRELEHRGSTRAEIAPQHRCAVNLLDVSSDEIGRGDVLVAPNTWWPATTFIAVMHWLVADPPRSGRGSLLLHVGTTAVAVRMSYGADPQRVTLRVDEPLALKPGDRVVVRDTGRNVTLAGGEIVEVDPSPVTWRHVDEVRRRTMRSVAANVGEWVAPEGDIERLRAVIGDRLDRDGSIEVASLDDRERLVVEDLVAADDDTRNSAHAAGRLRGPWTLSHGVLRRGAGFDDAERRMIDIVRNAGVTGPSAASLDRAVARRLVARGEIIECAGIAFHRSVVIALAPVVADLLAESPAGFTVAALRERLKITRKHAVPLAEALDHVGVTRRMGDVRVAGSAESGSSSG
jgi:selenocysteine-specific elongation factor